MVSQCIYAQRERERFIALTVIEFLAYSRERVLLSRIEHLLSRHSEPQGNRKFARGADEITQACRGLVIYDAKFEVLHFNHPCVNEYLEDVLDPRFAHAWIAELCLRELLGSASLVSKSPDTSPPTVRESTEFLTVREFPPYAAKHWFYHARHSIRAHEFDNAERQFLQDPLAVQAWMRILDWSVTDAERRVCGYRMFFAFARAFPDSMGMLFLASYFVGDDEVCQTLSESLVLATAWGVRMPSFEHILSSIPWSRDFTQLSSLRQAAEACYGLTEREAKRRSGLSWCLMYATELYQLLAVLNDVRCAGILCAAEQGHESIFRMLWTQLENLIPKSLLRLVGDCSCLLATAGQNVGVLDYLNSVGHAFGTQSSVVPFNYVHGGLF